MVKCGKSMKSWTYVLMGLGLACGLLIGLGWLRSQGKDSEAGAGAADAQSNAVNWRAAARSSGAQYSRSRPDRGSALGAGENDQESSDTNKVPRAVIESFLSSKGRNAESLLAAFTASQDKAYLKEAAANFPQNRQIQLAMVLNPSSPEEQRAWLDRYKQNDQANAVGHYLSALNYLQQKNPESAMQDLTAASTYGLFNTYRQDQATQLEELHLAAGFSPAEAKKAAMEGCTGPKVLSNVKELADQIMDLQQQCLQANDRVSAATLANYGLRMGRRLNFDGGGMLLNDQLVGISVEQQFLTLYETASTPGFVEKPVAQRQAELQRQKDTLNQQAAAFAEFYQNQTDETVLLDYYNRVENNGEAAALRWWKSTQQNP
jgi:hypothetical protein